MLPDSSEVASFFLQSLEALYKWNSSFHWHRHTADQDVAWLFCGLILTRRERSRYIHTPTETFLTFHGLPCSVSSMLLRSRLHSLAVLPERNMSRLVVGCPHRSCMAILGLQSSHTTHCTCTATCVFDRLS